VTNLCYATVLMYHTLHYSLSTLVSTAKHGGISYHCLIVT